MGLLDVVTNLFKSEEATPAVLPGRNEPCWCGSGKKYKKCHEPADQAKAAKAAASKNCCGPT